MIPVQQITFVGIDPSLRHTGVCLLRTGRDPWFYEIKTDDLPVLHAGSEISSRISEIMSEEGVGKFIVGIERQLPNSGTLFYAMMVVVETLNKGSTWDKEEGPSYIMPLPVQLKSYMVKRMNLDVSTKRKTVEGVKKLIGTEKRLSQHNAEAFCLAMMAKDLYEGKAELRLPEKETPILPREMVFGTK